jgi:hypothetical protein
MPRKITHSGLLADRPSPFSVPNSYYFASDEGKYYSAEGERWVERIVDVDDLAPDTEAYLACGITHTGAIDPIKVGAGPVDNQSGTITAGGTAQVVSAANDSRRYFMFQNISDTDMYVGVGYTPEVGLGLLISKNGGTLTCDSFVPVEEIKVVCATTGKKFTAFEA